jgi:hypothetical protein
VLRVSGNAVVVVVVVVEVVVLAVVGVSVVVVVVGVVVVDLGLFINFLRGNFWVIDSVPVCSVVEDVSWRLSVSPPNKLLAFSSSRSFRRMAGLISSGLPLLMTSVSLSSNSDSK